MIELEEAKLVVRIQLFFNNLDGIILFILSCISIDNKASNITEYEVTIVAAPNNPQLLKKFMIPPQLFLLSYGHLIKHPLHHNDGFLMFIMNTFYINEINLIISFQS